MGPNLNPDARSDKTTTLAILIKDQSEASKQKHFISLRRSVFHYHRSSMYDVDTQIETDRKTLEKPSRINSSVRMR